MKMFDLETRDYFEVSYELIEHWVDTKGVTRCKTDCIELGFIEHRNKIYCISLVSNLTYDILEIKLFEFDKEQFTIFKDIVNLSEEAIVLICKDLKLAHSKNSRVILLRHFFRIGLREAKAIYDSLV